MGARPSSFKKGGGFLNGVDGVIVSYEFTDEFNGEAYKATKDPKTGKVRFHAINCLLGVKVDGAEETVFTTLFVGGFDDFTISEDGLTLTPNEDGRELGAGVAFTTLIASLCAAGFPEENLPEDEINFEAIIGTRVRFEQKTNDELTKKLGKRVGKDGKTFNRQDLVITNVYDLPGKAAKPAAGKSAAKPAAGKAKKSAEPDFTQEATDVVLAVLAANDGQVAKSKLAMKVTQKLLKHENREEIRILATSDEFLATEAGWTFNAKKGIIAIAEEEDSE
jgi:hypothetical protein